MENLRISNQIVRCMLAEFLGTFVVVLLSECNMAVVIINGLQTERYLIQALMSGASYAIATQLTNTVSSHLNPAVTLGLALAGRCTLIKIIPLMLAQYLAGTIAALTIYAIKKGDIYAHAGGFYAEGEKSTVAIFIAQAKQHDYSPIEDFVEQVVATKILLIFYMSMYDIRRAVPLGLQPMLLFICISGLCLATGSESGSKLNPAQELGPRFVASQVGYGSEILSEKRGLWILTLIVAPHVGGIIGAWLYRLLIQMHYSSRALPGPTLGSSMPYGFHGSSYSDRHRDHSPEQNHYTSQSTKSKKNHPKDNTATTKT